MIKRIARFSADEDGATAIEYGLIASLIALVLVVALSATGDGTMAKWQYVMERVSTALGGAAPDGDGGGAGETGS